MNDTGTVFEFAPLVEHDMEMLADWFARPHLRASWRENQLSLDELARKYLIDANNPDPDQAIPFIAKIGGRPVGYIQYYDATQNPGYWGPHTPPPGTIGIDMFLAAEEDIGRGIGRRMATEFIDYLDETIAPAAIWIDPNPDNIIAIRCYRAAGFRDCDTIETPEGPALLMKFEGKRSAKS